MANRVFQSVIYQMKDAINRVVGVVDETGAVISCSELNLIGEVLTNQLLHTASDIINNSCGLRREGFKVGVVSVISPN